VIILVVDDDESLRESVASFFVKRAHTILVAAHGAEALEILSERAVDLVITDIKMPVLDGIGLLKEAKSRHPALDVLLITGHADTETAIEATRHGATDYLRKPFALRDLLNAVNKIDEKRRLRQELARKDAQLQRSRRLASLGSLAAGVMHEINNPNTYILGNAQLIIESLLPALADERVKPVIEEKSRLTLEEIEETIQCIRKGSERIAEIVRKTMGSCLAMPDDARSDAITQLFSSLLVNAAEAVADRADARVIVTASVDAAVLTVAVIDNGPGVPPELRERIFDPFYTTRQNRAGRGLGLFIAHSIVDSVNGELSVVEAPGGGACFTVRLPLAAPKEENS